MLVLLLCSMSFLNLDRVNKLNYALLCYFSWHTIIEGVGRAVNYTIFLV